MGRKLLLWPLVAVLASGCGASRSITIDSDPGGAVVRASGRDIGRTPLRIDPDQVFPPRFVGGRYQAVGELVVAKPGCEPYRRRVDDAVLSRDIQVKLACRPVQRPPQEPVRDPDSGATGQRNASPSIERRLRVLEGLRRDGLVTEGEYKAIRRRILDAL